MKQIHTIKCLNVLRVISIGCKCESWVCHIFSYSFAHYMSAAQNVVSMAEKSNFSIKASPKYKGDFIEIIKTLPIGFCMDVWVCTCCVTGSALPTTQGNFKGREFVLFAFVRVYRNTGRLLWQTYQCSALCLDSSQIFELMIVSERPPTTLSIIEPSLYPCFSFSLSCCCIAHVTLYNHLLFAFFFCYLISAF